MLNTKIFQALVVLGAISKFDEGPNPYFNKHREIDLTYSDYSTYIQVGLEIYTEVHNTLGMLDFGMDGDILVSAAYMLQRKVLGDKDPTSQQQNELEAHIQSMLAYVDTWLLDANCKVVPAHATPESV